MGLQGAERRLERMVEGAFSRVFRSGLKPVEIGRRLVREMDGNRSVGVNGQPVVPNDFTIALSSDDLERFSDVREVLQRELCEAARSHGRDEKYSFMGPISVELVEGDGLRAGRFEIVGRMRQGEGGAGAGSLVLPTGERIVLGEFVVTVGRLPECTITLGDPNASRHHAEIRPYGDGYLLRDLGSTNGTKVNGARVTERELVDGDEITFGSTSVGFEAS